MDISQVTIRTSIAHKGRIAPNGLVFFIAKIKDKKNKMEYTIHELVNRKDATAEDIAKFEFAMKKSLVERVNAKL